MINLFRFLIRNSSFFLFVLFEIIAFYLIVNYNQNQNEIFINSSNRLSAMLLDRYDKVNDYFHLQRINESLNAENAYLLRTIEVLKRSQNTDSVRFDYRDAKIISNNISGRYNRFLLNRGHKDGVHKGMGVLYRNYPVGIVYQTTDHYSSAISILNVNFHLSASVKNKGHFGVLTWAPLNPLDASLNHIPAHADVQLGDTVVTSGYSQVFPENLNIGVVEEIQTPRGSNLYEIQVRMFADVSKMEYVQTINNVNLQQIDSLLTGEEQ